MRHHRLAWLSVLGLLLPACGADPGAASDEPVLVEKDAAPTSDATPTPSDSGAAEEVDGEDASPSPAGDSAATETATDTGTPPTSTAPTSST